MAKAKSHLMSVIRGSVGGLTYTANQFQSIVMRARVSPVNPGSVTQSIIRLAMGAANAAWEIASQITRDGWAAYAQSLVFTGPLGPYSVPGRQVGLAQYNLSQYAVEMGVGTIDAPSLTPPVDAGFLGLGPVVSVPLDETGTGFEFSITNPQDEDITVLAWISLRQPESRNRYKGPWNPAYFHSHEVVGNGTSSLVVTDLPADGIYFVRLRAISSDAPRRLSTAQVYRSEATTHV